LTLQLYMALFGGHYRKRECKRRPRESPKQDIPFLKDPFDHISSMPMPHMGPHAGGRGEDPLGRGSMAVYLPVLRGE